MSNFDIPKPPPPAPQRRSKKLYCLKAEGNEGALCFKWESVDCILKTRDGQNIVRIAGENFIVHPTVSVSIEELQALWEQSLND